MSDPYELSDFLRSRVRELRQPAPILEFFEVSIPGGTPLRYVDFADPDARGTLPKKVPFNGEEFDSISIKRGDIQESQEGSAQSITVTVADPLHQAAFYLRENNYLEGETVQWWLTAYDQLDTPADALTHTFRIVHSRISEGPPRVSIVLGHPNLYEERLPKYFYDRGRCVNSYHRRFVFGNRCTYPSNEFGPQNQQDLFIGGSYGEKKRKFGWYTQMALKASEFKTNLTTPGRLVITSTDPELAWENDNRYGPYFYRPIAAGDFDVNTRVLPQAFTRPGWLAGLLCQDTASAAPIWDEGEPEPPIPTSSWIFWGAHDDGASGKDVFRRSTEDSVSTDAVFDAFADPYFRMERIADDFKLYSRASPLVAWSLRETVELSLPATVRVGLVIGTDDVIGSEELTIDFDYIRFDGGGLPTCSFNQRDANGCEVHDNTVQFNGFEEIPNDRVR